jgi:hypothetical protein
MRQKVGNSKGSVVRAFSAIWRGVTEIVASLEALSVTFRLFFPPENVLFF